MSYKNMLVLLLLLIGTAGFAQSTDKPQAAPGNEPLLEAIASVDALADKVNAATAEVAAAATGSRAVAVEAQAKLDAAYTAYLAELNNQLKLQSGETATAIQREIALVEKLRAGETPSQR